MSTRYAAIQSPIRIGNVILKSRLVAANALPHFMQGPERYPSEGIIRYLAGLARNGAAIVDFADWSDASVRDMPPGDICHFPVYDLEDPATENYMTQLADAVHFYGSKISVALSQKAPRGYGVYDDPNPGIPEMMKEMMEEDEGQGHRGETADPSMAGKDLPPSFMAGKMPPAFPFPVGPQKAMTQEQMDDYIAESLKKIHYYRNCGFDMCTLHMSYRSTLPGMFLSPLTNKRTDQYGGSMENRSRFPLSICRAIRKEFGPDFLIEVQISGEDGLPGGNTIDDMVQFAKLAEDCIDILQIRAGNASDAHPTGFNSAPHKPITLAYAEAIRKSGMRILTEPIGGYQNPDDMESYIREGKTDLIGLARAFICDPDYGQKIREGRGEDVVPCIRCNKCHGVHSKGPWLSVCSVNPRMGQEQRLEALIPAATAPKKVAVIGGGPAGMQAAITASDRGHQVVLFEKSGWLGGQLFHADYASFKWPVREFKEYLIRQIKKRPVEVRMNTVVSPEQLESEGFEVILAATGAEPVIPDIKGARNEDGSLKEGLWNPLQVYGNQEALGHRVVMIGGSEIGVETALYLADEGHEVTVLSRQKKLAQRADRVHYYEIMRKYWKENERFSSLCRAVTTEVTPTSVTYRDAAGSEHVLDCDSVVVCGGMRSRQEEAFAYASAGIELHVIGDALEPGSIQKSIRSAYGIASAI